MAIIVTLVPAGQAPPPGYQLLVRIQCRQQLPQPLSADLASASGATLADTATEHDHFVLPLPAIASDDYDELWLVPTQDQNLLDAQQQAIDQLGVVHTRRYGDFQLCWLWFYPQSQSNASSHQEFAQQAYERYQQAYEQVLHSLEDSPYPHLQKIWHYLPAINSGAGDRENYRLFCQGRELALRQRAQVIPQLPAATAIGIPDAQSPALFYWLSTRTPGLNIENPRQMHAWKYPRQYGPSRPNFSRGTLSPAVGQFLISGTASVVGHETIHPHDTAGQIQEMLLNLDSLLDSARAQQNQVPNSKSLPTYHSLTGAMRLYLRQPEQASAVRQRCAELGLPLQQLKFCHGDICRDDLMIEMDGFQSF
jgi:chorismate lyase/3-hydroxybenzoate synthase